VIGLLWSLTFFVSPSFAADTGDSHPAGSSGQTSASGNGDDLPFRSRGFGTARVIGGLTANPGVWPYAALVLISNRFQCGGTLISKSFVLTAGHCAIDPETKNRVEPGAYEIRVGSVYRDRGGEVHHVKRVLLHEGFSGRTLENDIALLELSDPASDSVPPVALDGMPDLPSGSRLQVDANPSPFAKIVGWGRTNPDPQVFSVSDQLLEAAIPIIDNDVCQRANQSMLAEFGAIDSRRLCAGQSSGGVDTCGGDSGGPILSQSTDMRWVQVGLVSYGASRCGEAGAYGVYTRVRSFSAWLKKNLQVTVNDVPVPNVPVSPITSAATIIAAAEKNDGQVKVDILDAGAFQENSGTCSRVAALETAKAMPVNECLKVRVTSAFPGYLLLLDLSEDGKITQLFPNSFSEKAFHNGKVGTRPLVVPDTDAFELPTSLESDHRQERNRVIAVVSQNKISIGNLGLSKSVAGEVLATEVARLEVVLKPGPGGGGSSSTAGRWAAGQHDYLVNR
jgi:secreted trypsin-like serine protease